MATTSPQVKPIGIQGLMKSKDLLMAVVVVLFVALSGELFDAPAASLVIFSICV